MIPAIHPYLFALFGVLFAFSNSVGRTRLHVVWLPLVSTMAAVAIAHIALTRVLRSQHRAGVLVSAGTLLAFGYGHVRAALASSTSMEAAADDRVLVPTTFLVFMLIVVAACRPPRAPRDLSRYMNNVATIVVLMSLLVTTFGYSSATLGWGKGGRDLSWDGGSGAGPLPDIYYIVLDRYPSADTLRTDFGFDNGDFLAELRSRGFHVPEQARSNYPRTMHSLASVLNMRYLEEIFPPARTGPHPKPLLRTIHDNQVGRRLKDLGYTNVQIGSWWEGTAHSDVADVQPRYGPKRSEFSLALFESTLVGGIRRFIAEDWAYRDWRTIEYERTLFQFEQIELARTVGRPVFTMAHLILPHEPYMFRADGSFKPLGEEAFLSDRRNFVEQVEFANRRILETIDRLLEPGEGPQPVVILQSDEGPHPVAFERDPQGYEWLGAPDRDLSRKFGILNALHLPGVDPDELPEQLTSVNTFRIVFDAYFGTNLGLLPDRSFVYPNERNLYTFFDITDRL